MTETPMSDAELDELVATHEKFRGNEGGGPLRWQCGCGQNWPCPSRTAITQLRTALADAHTERDTVHIHILSVVSELKAVEEDLAAAQRRDTERAAELAAAVADNGYLVGVIEDFGKVGNLSENELGRIRFILSTNHPGAALLREHERRGAVVEAARKPCGPERDTAIAREIFAAITAERERQERLKVERGWKWSIATPGVSNFERLMPLMEELGEVAHAIRVAEGFAVAGNSHDNHGLRAELIQVAACAVAWLEALGAEDAALRAVRAEAKEERA